MKFVKLFVPNCRTHSLSDFNFGCLAKKGGQENTDLMRLCVVHKSVLDQCICHEKTRSVLFFFLQRDVSASAANFFLKVSTIASHVLVLVTTRGKEIKRNKNANPFPLDGSHPFPHFFTSLLALFLCCKALLHMCMCRLQTAKCPSYMNSFDPKASSNV